jgi:hypothetical protein
MAYFAEIDNTNTVLQVIAVNNADVDNLPFPESELVGQAFIASIGIEGTWLQTSYNANFRNHYAGINWTYDVAIGEYGAFVSPVPPNPNPPSTSDETPNS